MKEFAVMPIAQTTAQAIQNASMLSQRFNFGLVSINMPLFF
jgi:hypothetical protein